MPSRTSAGVSGVSCPKLFVPIGDLFIEDDGLINQAIMPDYLHLSEKGYQIWFGAISTELNSHLNTSNAPPK